MILRPLEPPPAAGGEFLPAWSVVERLQRQSYDDGCWMITQPSHAALAGEFAGKLVAAQFPPLDLALLRGIALHDAGWGVPDAQAIMQSRSVNHGCPKSFVDCSASEFLSAWEKSIDVAAAASPASGYIVSRHFYRLVEQHVGHHGDNADSPKLERFMKDESRRQEQLAARQEHNPEELELLTDVLQFCDLLSLYVCCGAQEPAGFPEYFGVKARLTVQGTTYRLEPELLPPGTTFQVATLRHPPAKGVSGQQIEILFRAA